MRPSRSTDYVRAEQRRFRRAKTGKAWSVPDLPQFYYLTHFKTFLTDVHREHFDCLGPEELDFLTQFENMPKLAQCTYVRMANRRGYVFDIKRFSYSEIDNIEVHLDHLKAHEFATDVTADLTADWLLSLTKPDLTAQLADWVCPTTFRKSWKKDRLIDVALDHISGSNGLEPVYIPSRFFAQGKRDTLQYLLFLHFGRIEDNLQAFTLRDLGLVKLAETAKRVHRFESADEAKTAFFYARALHQFRYGRDEQTAALIGSRGDWPDPQCPQSFRHRDKLLQKLGGWAERNVDTETALGLYDVSDTPLCNERAVRLRWSRDDEGDRQWVETRLEMMIDNPSSDSEAVFAEDFYARKFEKKRTSVTTDLLRAAKTLTLDEAFRNQPERAALLHYRDNGLEAYRTENVPWRNLFGLLFWDLLGREAGSRWRVPPALRYRTFYPKYERQIEAILTELDVAGTVMLRLLKTLSKHYGEDSAIVHWGSKSLDRVQALIHGSPPGALAAIMRSMAQDWPGMKDGYPDLMLIECGRTRFIEIKTDGDTLRRNQLTRIRQLKAAGYDCDIVRVDWGIDPDQPYIVVDVETTGGRPGLHRLTEIGAVKMIGGEVVDEFQTLINPQRSIPPNITRITGISDEMVAGAPVFAEIAEQFRMFMGDAIFVAHNVNFDYGFISAEFAMIDQRFRHPKLCTCASMRKLYPGHRSYSLKNLCRTYDISLESHHRALCDARAAAELLKLINAKRCDD